MNRRARLARILILSLATISSVGVLELIAEPIISEIMAANSAGLRDEDGAFSDWIELHNPDSTPVNLDGWYLTDSATALTRWRLPAVILPPDGYLVVFASNKNRTDPAGILHTNFALGAGGEYLGLIKPNGTTIVSEFAPGFPPQSDDVSYGRVALADGTMATGFLRSATPGAANGGPEMLTLAETVSFSRPSSPFTEPIVVELFGAAPGQRIRYVVAVGSYAGETEVTASSPEYTRPLVLSRSAVVRAAVFSADNTLQGTVSTAHYLRLDESLASFSSQLPVLVLDNLGAGEQFKDGYDYPSWLYGYSAADIGSGTFSAAPIHRTPALQTVRGNSSAAFPKRGFNVKLRDTRGAKRALPLFGLGSFDKWAMVAPWSHDQNYINNAFVYSLSNRIGRWAPRTQLFELFNNVGGDDLQFSDHAGIYLLTDRIEAATGRLEIPELSPSDRSETAISGGYILKIDSPDDDEFGWRTAANLPDDTYSSIILVSPDPDDATPEQKDYIRDYVQQMEDALLRDQSSGWAQRTYLDYIDRDSWVDHHILNVFVSNPDAFVRSAYFHKTRGGRLAAGPVWDFDRALGSHVDYRGETARTWSGSIEPDVDFWRSGWWAIIAQDPEFMQDWVDRWQALRRTHFAENNLFGLVDGLANTVGTAAADRDAARWPDNQSPTGSYAGQIQHLKDWLRRRADWIDTQFVLPPTVVASGSTLTFIPAPGAQLAYTDDGSDPRALGGQLAPNAILSASAITVGATTNIHVRSYRADLRDVFPGTPWSSAVGGAGSSPLRPQGRIINISTRALVGRGESALIAGVVVADTDGKRYLARAIGPGLAAFGATDFVTDPQLSIISSSGSELARNLGWESDVDAARLPALSRSVGAFPLAPESLDSALAAKLPAGSYSIEISTPTGQEGVGLAELYELDAKGRTVNLSTRAFVREGDGTLIGGFVVAGAAHKRMLIRAVGPTLSRFGVNNALPDSVLTIYAGANTVATNDRWQDSENATAVRAAATSVGAFQLAEASEDAALLITLPPGAYTVEIQGKETAAGVALLEIYEIP